MSVLRTEHDSLLLSDPSLSRSTVHVGVSHPTPGEEQQFGKLYLIAEIDTPDRINHDIISALQEELRSAYYHADGLTLDQAFEAALKRGNERLHRFMTEGVTDWVDHFSAIVAVVKNDYLTFSQIGNVQTYLFSGNRITDVAGKAGIASEKRNPLKLFSTVLSGHCKANDRVLLCTASLLDYFSLEKLKRMIVEDLPSATVSRIEQSLLAHATPTAFAAEFIAFLAVTEAVPEPITHATPTAPAIRQQSAPERSMNDLIMKERTTEQLLSPSMMPNLKTLAQGAFTSVAKFVRTSLLRQPPRRRVPVQYRPSTAHADIPQAPVRPHPAMQLLKKVGMALVIGIVSIPRWIGALVGYQKKVSRELKQLPDRTTTRANGFVRWVRSLTTTQRVIAIGALIALFILSETIIAANTRSSKTASTSSATETVATIQENISKAEAAVTYSDYDGAIRLLNDSQTLLDSLPNKSTKDKQTRTDLTNKLAAARALTRRVETPSLTTIASFGSTFGTAQPTGLAMLGSTALVTTNAAGSGAMINVANGTVTAVTTTTHAFRYAVGFDSQSALLGTAENTVQRFTEKNTVTADAAIQFANVDRSIVAGTLYQSRLYLLDTANKAILRSNVSGTSFGPATSWLKQSYDELSTATGLAVDGSIYVTLSNGTIEQFTAGTKDAVTFGTIDPALTAPTQLWTSAASTKLYVLEPSQKRIVVFVKSSHKLLVQYVADGLSGAAAFSVDEKNKTIYVVTAAGLSKFTTTQ